MASNGAQQTGLPNELVETFVAITNSTREHARFLLEACEGDLDRAVAVYMEQHYPATGQQTQRYAAVPPRPLAPVAPPNSTSNTAARQPQQPGGLLGAAIQIPAWFISSGVRLMAHALGLGFNAVTLMGNLVLPASIKQQLQALAASLSQRMEGMTGELAARTFKNSFTLHYGQPQPHWLECGWQQAAAQAHASFKFLFIYLHAPDHQDTDAFCKGVLQSSEVLEYIDNQFLCWGGDIRHTDAWRLSMAVQASRYPYVGLMAFSGSRTRLVAASEGLCTPAQLLAMLREAVNQYGAEFVADQAEASQVELNRRLREEQDAEYEAGLRADQERERKRQEEEQKHLEQQRAAEQAEAEQRAAAEAEAQRKADAENQLRQRKADKRNALPSEPSASTAQVASIRVRLPDGSNAQRRFHAHDKLQAVYDFVDSLENLSSLKYSLATNFPRMEYGSDKLQQSLEELKLTPSAMLLVQYITD